MDNRNLLSYGLGYECCNKTPNTSAGTAQCRSDIYGCCTTPLGPGFPAGTYFNLESARAFTPQEKMGILNQQAQATNVMYTRSANSVLKYRPEMPPNGVM